MLSINSKIKQFKHRPLWEWVKRDFVNKEDNTDFSTFGDPCAIHSNTYWNNQHLNLSTTSLPLRSNIGRFWPEITMNPRIYLRNEQSKWETTLCQMFNNTRERIQKWFLSCWKVISPGVQETNVIRYLKESASFFIVN